MSNIRIWLQFDGTDFHGYQIQKNGFSVQETIQNAVRAVTGERINIIGCSRTDAGVHAKQYCANFFSETKIPLERLPLALNTHLPEAVRVYEAQYAKPDFHATFSAKEKTYVYTINTNKIADPFTARYAWHYPYALDIEAMKKGAEYILGKHDFSAFRAAGAQTKTSVRTVKKIDICEKSGIVKISVTADGFLYNMVRIITGTLLYVGIGKIAPQGIEEIILSKDRKKSGITAPPQGLMLVSVVY